MRRKDPRTNKSGANRNCGFAVIQLPKPKAIKWRGRPAIFRRGRDAESSVFLRTSAPSLYAEQLSPAGRRLNAIGNPPHSFNVSKENVVTNNLAHELALHVIGKTFLPDLPPATQNTLA